MKTVIFALFVALLCIAATADAQIGGTLLSLQARPPAASHTSPMLTGNGHGMTFGGQGGTE